MFTAVVRITGAGRLEDFRERLRWLMVRDIDAEDFTEHHGEGRLEYRFAPRRGIPFPAFTECSEEFPELRVEAEWEHDGVRGRAVIENGKLVQDLTGATASGIHVEVAEDGRLVLGLALRDALGYAVTAERQTYFRFRDGKLELVGTDEADEALEEVAFGFVDEWIWYDEQDAPLERARYADYGYPVRGANVKPEKLAALRRSGLRVSSLEPAAEPLREALLKQWLKT